MNSFIGMHAGLQKEQLYWKSLQITHYLYTGQGFLLQCGNSWLLFPWLLFIAMHRQWKTSLRSARKLMSLGHMKGKSMVGQGLRTSSPQYRVFGNSRTYCALSMWESAAQNLVV